MNKRLRKKKRIGEFQELGFIISFNKSTDSVDLIMKMIDFVESNNLGLGGGYNPNKSPNFYFFISSLKNRGTCKESDREVVRNWLEENNMSDIFVGELRDCWYGWKKDFANL